MGLVRLWLGVDVVGVKQPLLDVADTDAVTWVAVVVIVVS